VQTAEQVYKCAAKHWAEQSVCTSLHENALTHSVLLGSKYGSNGNGNGGGRKYTRCIYESGLFVCLCQGQRSSHSTKVTTDFTLTLKWPLAVQGRDSLRGAQIWFFSYNLLIFKVF
jgi:hypothetical protein